MFTFHICFVGFFVARKYAVIEMGVHESNWCIDTHNEPVCQYYALTFLTYQGIFPFFLFLITL